ncbi:MAG: hypothetical protein K2W95_07590 [Candidatus Obscuribacterales bacterium]|nr:hypothetical protein [Candidatus Obscuribacterales bacterium]
MKLIGIAALIAGLFLASPPWSSAGEVSFVPSGDSNAGTLRGDAPLPLLGGLPLRNGTVVINDKVVSIKCAPDEFSETPRTVLAGSVLRTESTVNGANSSMTGLVVFLMGEWMQHLDDPNAPDVLFRNEGQVRGKIIGRDGDNVIVQTAEGAEKRVALSTVLYIRSPRVFVFTIQAKNKGPVEKDTPFNAVSVSSTFRPTSTPRSVSLSSVVPRKPGEEELSSGKPASAMSPSELFEQDELPAATPMPRFTNGPPAWIPQSTGYQ